MHDKRAVAIIPARLGSSRLPGKPLADICGRPMILRVMERVRMIRAIREAVVATDSPEIMACVQEAGFRAVMTDSTHPSGTDRIAEAARTLGLEPDELVINVQGDQPLVEVETVEAVLDALENNRDVSMATAACPVGGEEAIDPNRVKVVVDNHGMAIYFSRSIIPFDRDGALRNVETPYLRHLGIYSYSMEFLQKFVKMPRGHLESIEKLEQLRVLENGFKIAVRVVTRAPIDVDTREDLENIRKVFLEKA